MRVPRSPRPGRPRGPLPDAAHPLTRRIRRLIDEAHLGNLREAASHTGLPYATVRDLYRGRTASPGLATVQTLAAAYGLPLDWFTGGTSGDAQPRFQIDGELLPDPEYGRGRRGRRIRIPLAAWPLARCFVRLEQRLTALPPKPARPVLGAAVDPAEVRQRLTAFLLGPLLDAQDAGLLAVQGADPPFRGGGNPSAEEAREWIAVLRALGRFWERALETGE